MPSEEIVMEGQRERTSSRRRQRRKSKASRGKVTVEPVLIAARRPDSPRLENGFRNVVASAQPKAFITASPAAASESGHGLRNGSDTAAFGNGSAVNGASSHRLNSAGLGSDLREGDIREGDEDADDLDDGQAPEARAASGSSEATSPSVGVRRRAVRIVKLADNVLTPGNREQQLLDRLMRSQGRGAISRAADDLWEGKFVAPKRQEIQIQLLEHENETRARDAVFAMAELLQREAPIKRPVLDQRLRRLETSAEDPITRDAAGALRRSMRVHHGL
jgi:hypothetical protein